ncbi:LETM1-related biofilm-associated protein [Flavobacteriaceae bacterium TK19130]|nr:LETM1-related biofilm-associated protein [Thermobacterium salinum]
MNPSASGWIPKFLFLLKEGSLTFAFDTNQDFYTKLRTTGFLYGWSVSTIMEGVFTQISPTKEELTKVNLLSSLLFVHSSDQILKDPASAIAQLVTFYKEFDKEHRSWLQLFHLRQQPSTTLEKILSARLHERSWMEKKNATSLLTYTLLFLDVLRYEDYLRNDNSISEYSKLLESSVISCCYLALRSKKQKRKYDHLLIDLFESSSEFLAEKTTVMEIVTLEHVGYLSEADHLTRLFILEVCCLAVWDDRAVDEKEAQFLGELAELLQLPLETVGQCLEYLKQFSDKHATKISLFEYDHPVKQLYKQSVRTVRLLIFRNQKRLRKELEESGELLVLLSQSTVRELSKAEKQQMHEQLLDICKSIPSLTVFLLPGGSLLLPLLIKFIPELLPSAFQENRISKGKKGKA